MAAASMACHCGAVDHAGHDLFARSGRFDPERTGRAPRQDRHGGEVYAYRRAGLPCLVCGTPIAHVEHAARNLFWCPTCQPADGDLQMTGKPRS
jgi:formamidopyrimidine-DNA glycosylase